MKIVGWGLAALVVAYLAGATALVYGVLDNWLVARADAAPEMSLGEPVTIAGAPGRFVAGSNPVWAIYVHGLGGGPENGARFLPELTGASLPVLLIGYRNDAGAAPAAEGIYGFGLTEWPDLEAAVQHALDGGATGVVLIGDSMGAAISGEFLRRSPLASKVVGVVLDSPALYFPAFAGARVPGLPVAPWTAMLAYGAVHGVPLMDANTVDVFGHYAGPLLLIHGADDTVTPVGPSDAMAKMRAGPTTFWRPAGDHLTAYTLDPGRFDNEIRAFLERF